MAFQGFKLNPSIESGNTFGFAQQKKKQQLYNFYIYFDYFCKGMAVLTFHNPAMACWLDCFVAAAAADDDCAGAVTLSWPGP